jgi:hypothetical protein
LEVLASGDDVLPKMAACITRFKGRGKQRSALQPPTGGQPDAVDDQEAATVAIEKPAVLEERTAVEVAVAAATPKAQVQSPASGAGGSVARREGRASEDSCKASEHSSPAQVEEEEEEENQGKQEGEGSLQGLDGFAAD